MSYAISFQTGVKDSMQQILSNAGDDWAIYGYAGQTMELKLQCSGTGLAELADEFSDGQIQYSFCRVIDPLSSLFKFVLISWCGEGVPTSRKGVFNSHVGAVSGFFSGVSVHIQARVSQDVEEAQIMKKVMDSSGAKYSIQQGVANPSIARPTANKAERKSQPNSVIDYSKPKPAYNQHVHQTAVSYAPTQPHDSHRFAAPASSQISANASPQSNPFPPKVSQDQNIQPSFAKSAALPAVAATTPTSLARKNLTAEVHSSGGDALYGSVASAYVPVKTNPKKLGDRAAFLNSEPTTASSYSMPKNQEHFVPVAAAQPIYQQNTTARVSEPHRFGSQSNTHAPSIVAVLSSQLDAAAGSVHRFASASSGASHEQVSNAQNMLDAEARRFEADAEADEYKRRLDAEAAEMRRHLDAKAAEDRRKLDAEAAENRRRLDADTAKAQHQLESEAAETKRLLDAANANSHIRPFPLETFMVEHDYSAVDSNELSIVAGEILQVTRMDADWWPAVNAAGREGLVPASYMSERPVDLSAQLLQPISALNLAETPAMQAATNVETVSLLPHVPAEHASTKTGVAIYEYAAVEPGELNLQPDQTITEIVCLDSDWWQGTSHGVTGLFPASYIQLKDARITAKALFPHEAAEDNELSFPAGAMIYDVVLVTDEWWQGTYNGSTGLCKFCLIQSRTTLWSVYNLDAIV